MQQCWRRPGSSRLPGQGHGLHSRIQHVAGVQPKLWRRATDTRAPPTAHEGVPKRQRRLATQAARCARPSRRPSPTAVALASIQTRTGWSSSRKAPLAARAPRSTTALDSRPRTAQDRPTSRRHTLVSSRHAPSAWVPGGLPEASRGAHPPRASPGMSFSVGATSPGGAPSGSTSRQQGVGTHAAGTRPRHAQALRSVRS